ncbi:MAG: reprolysin-like metallopeptidase [Aquabacterium sp.]|uniref:reprolysin-like metallopeptidase n=1 Tax=Aquabacterium sp. TaxID=1872578 RepID=UPI003BCA3CB6
MSGISAAISVLLMTSAQAAINPAAQSSGMTAAPAVSASDAGLQLDSARLMAMKAGEKMPVTFPVFGRQTIVLETTMRGADGYTYWHARVDGRPLDRVFIKQTAAGFVGGVRMAGRQVAFSQSNQGGLTRQTMEASLASVAGQAYTLGAAVDKGAYQISGNFASIAQLPEGSEISLPLPNGKTEVVVVTKSKADEQGFYQVSGVSRQDGNTYPSLITVSKDAVFGTVLTAQGEYQIVTRNGRTQLVDPKAAGWKHVNGEDQMIDDAVVGAARTTAVTGAATATTTTTTTTTTTSVPTPLAAGTVDTVIPLQMAYTNTFVNQWGTETVARTRLSNLVAVANAAYANSGTGIQFKVVGWSLVNQADTTPQTNLPALRSGSGVFAAVQTAKAASGAAITVLFTPYNSVTGSTNTCGLAYIPGAGARGLSTYKIAAASQMYAVLNDGQNGGYYCESLSFAHELGHTLGNVHDTANTTVPGVFSYSYGKGVTGSYGTVMSYVRPRVAKFSSPVLTCTSAGALCGSTTENTVASMLQTKSIAAALGKSTTTSLGINGSTVVAGWLVNSAGAAYTAGGVTVTATNTSVQCTTGTTGLYVCTVPASVTSVTVTPVATGKTVTPATGTFSVNPLSNTPINGTKFYIQ